MQNLLDEVFVDVKPHFVFQGHHQLLDRFHMSLTFRAQEDAENPHRLQSGLLGPAAAVAFVDQDALKPKLQSESDGGCLSAAQILLQNPNPGNVLRSPDLNPTLSDRLMNSLHSGVFVNGCELVENSVRDQNPVECVSQERKFVDGSEVEKG